MKKCCIDIGSNSVKYLIYDQELKSIVHQGNIANRLISYQDNHEIIIKEDSIINNIEIIQKIIHSEASLEKKNIDIIGTMALRNAVNASDFCDPIYHRFGIKIRILSKEEEASFNFISVISDFQIEQKDILLVNIGGGSVELTFSEGRNIFHQESIDIGAIVLKEKFFTPYNDRSVIGCIDYIMEQIKHLRSIHFDLFIGNGGAFSSINKFIHKIENYSFEMLHLQKIKRTDVELLFDQMLSRDSWVEEEIYHYVSKSHQDIMLQGMLIILSLLRIFDKELIYCSEKSLCHYFAER